MTLPGASKPPAGAPGGRMVAGPAGKASHAGTALTPRAATGSRMDRRVPSGFWNESFRPRLDGTCPRPQAGKQEVLMSATGRGARRSRDGRPRDVMSRVIRPTELVSRRSPRCGTSRGGGPEGFTTTRGRSSSASAGSGIVMHGPTGRTTGVGSPGPRSPRRSGSRCCT